MAKDLKLAIFDLDGTLVDSVIQIATILNATRQEFGYSVLPRTFYEESIGVPLKDLIADLELRDADEEMFIDSFRDSLTHDIQNGNNPVFNGVIEALDFLRNNSVSIAIATSKPTGIANEVYKSSKLSAYKIHVQGTDAFPPKPNPEVINRVLGAYPRYKAVMIGDRSEDMKAAQSAGISGIGLAASAHSQTQLRETGAVRTFENFEEFSRELLTNTEALFKLFT